ncbi:FecR domain-containing protein [Parapedobacter sp. ISTM3]|uniref:FecR family protein n=1 Tax=Parapedobacter sp. ISTM3 TaxID=2800130 RepID=UPI0019038692|nr:FecR domain-containing protein [Parapedobacter sp. ISTM3]MBK1440211.1 FecR domain-containing protein [Parapedobacter sp. ISTM3]
MEKKAEDYLDDEFNVEGHKYHPTDKQQWIAKAIVSLVRSVKGKPLSTPEKDELWRNVTTRWESERPNAGSVLGRRYRLWGSAAAVIIVAAGLLLFRYYEDHSDERLLNHARRLHGAGAATDGAPLLTFDQDATISLANASSIRIVGDTVETTDENGLTIRNTIQTRGDYASMTVPYGQRTTIELPDGTRVTLNAGSVLSFPHRFPENKREVSLIGEGFFEVAHQPDRPFYVYSENMQVKVLGTSFNVSAYSDDEEAGAYLVEGKIELTPMGAARFKPRILEKGTVATFNKRQGQLDVNLNSLENHAAWTQKRLVIRSATLASILRKLERFYNVEITLAQHRALGADRFSGVLDLQRPLQAILRDILNVEASEIKQKGRRITIK